MIEIKRVQEVSATVETVWSLVGDLEHEQRFWSALRNVKILRRLDDHTVEREASIKRGPMGEAKSFQTLSLDEAQKTTTLSMTKGPMLGARKVALSGINNGAKTKIETSWRFELKGIPTFAHGFVKDNISNETEKALEMIAEEAGRSKE